VTGTPVSSAAGPGPHSTTVRVGVQPLVGVNAPQQVAVPPCSTLHVPITLSPQPGFSGPVTLSVSGLPADDQATFAPATLTLPGQQTATLDITSQGDLTGPTGNVTVTATGQGFSDSSTPIAMTRIPPTITRVTNPSGTTVTGGRTPQGTSPDEGSVVYVRGQGFCPGSTVVFGNAKATATTQGPFTDGGGPYGDETVLRTSVPSLATSGQVYVVGTGQTIGSTHAKTPFTVDSYRDTDGFPFNNSDAFQSAVGGYSFSDVSDVFGDAQTHLSINPCWPFGDCTAVSPIPDPFALLFWGIADAALQGGQCFGFSMASQRLLHHDQSFSPFPLAAGGTPGEPWGLKGPDAPDGTPGASPGLAHFIHLMHMEQFSREGLLFWLSKATANAITGDQGSVMHDVTSALQTGDHPLVEIRNGTDGHVVVAYGVDQANGSPLVGSGDRVIDVYDPNEEFQANENQTDGSAHAGTMATSEIVVHPDGHWEFAGFSPEWHGGPGSLIVMPYGTVPVHPTLPTSGLTKLLLGAIFGSAKTTQVTDAHGHTLLAKDGALNSHHATEIPDATRFATLSGTPKPGPDLFLFGRPGEYTSTVRGRATGHYRQVFLGGHGAVTLTASTHAGTTDAIDVAPGADGVQFGTTSSGQGSRPATAQVIVDGSKHTTLTATVATSVPASGHAGVSFDAGRRAVDVSAGGSSTATHLTLSWAGPDGLPQTFTAPAVHLAKGDRARFAPARWSALQSSAVRLSIVHANGHVSRRTLHNTTHSVRRYSVAIRVTRHRAARRLTTAARFGHLAHGSSAVFVWQVLAGHKLVAHHTAVVRGHALHRGRVRRTYVFHGHGSARYRVRAAVELISPARGQTYAGQRVVRVARFTG
jgi:hypothetical protein